jgi:hypothetical protein
MIRVLSLVDPREVLRRRVRSQPFCGRCAAPLCMSRAVLAGEALVCGRCFEEMAEMAEIPGAATVLDGRKLFERKAKGGKCP